MFKRSKLIAGIALLVESVTLLIFFVDSLTKKKKNYGIFLGTGLVSALFGGLLIAWDASETSPYIEGFDDEDDCESWFDEDTLDDIDCVLDDDDTETEKAE